MGPPDKFASAAEGHTFRYPQLAIVARLRQEGRENVPRLPLYLLAAIVLPMALSIRPDGLLLTPYRVLCVGAFFFILLQVTTRKDFRWMAPDYFVCLYAVWGCLAYFTNIGVAEGLQSAGVIVLEALVPYFISRLLVTNLITLSAVARLGMNIVWVLLPLAIFEAISKVYIFRLLLQGGKQTLGHSDVRHGLLRAMTTFEHPILYGTFCASIFSMAWFILPRRLRFIQCAGILLSALLSGSSAAYLAVGLQIALASWDRLTIKLRQRWLLLGFSATSVFLIVAAISKRSMSSLLIAYFTLDPQTGWIRLAQWDYGWIDVGRNWLFGLGGKDWARPFWLLPSIDSYWLYIALNYGLPTLFAALGAAATSIALASKGLSRMTSEAEIRAAKAWIFTALALCFVGLTVDYWRAMHAMFFFLIGMGPMFYRRAPDPHAVLDRVYLNAGA